MKLLNQSLTKNNIVMRIFSKKWIWILLLLLISILIRSYHFYKAGPGFFPDSTQYLSMASNLIDHHKLESFGAMFPDIMRPVLYPIFVSIIYFFSNDILLSGVLVSLIAGCLSVVVVYYIANELFDSTVSKIAGLIAALNPTLVTVSTYCLTDSLSLLFLLLAYLFGLKLINNDRYIYAVYSGLFFAISFLTRQIVEIHIYAFLVFYAGVLSWRKKYYSLVRNLCFLVISVTIVVSPYIYHTYRETGRIIFNTGKDYYGVKDYVLMHKINDGFYGKVINSYENVSDDLKKRIEGEIAFRAINDNRDGLLTFDYYFKVAKPVKKLSIYAEVGKQGLRKIFGNVYYLLALFWYSFGFLMIFFFVGSCWLLVEKKWVILVFSLFAVMADLMIILQGHHEDRYAINILAFMTIITAFGMVNAFSFWIKEEKHRVGKWIMFLILVILVVGGAVSLPKKYAKSIDFLKNENEILYRVTDEFRNNLKPDSRVAARWPTYVFLLNGRYVPLPIAEYDGTVEYFKKKGIEYLIMDPDAIKLRPFFTISKLNQDGTFRLERRIETKNGEWYLYKTIK